MTETKLQNFIPTARSISLALILMVGSSSLSAYAAGKTPEDNSVYNWGSWDHMVSPAAGPDPGMSAITSAYTAPEFTPDVKFSTPAPREFSCGTAALCGFGGIVNNQKGFGSKIPFHSVKTTIPVQIGLNLFQEENAVSQSGWDPRMNTQSLNSFDHVSGSIQFSGKVGDQSFSNNMSIPLSSQAWNKSDILPDSLWSVFGVSLRDQNDANFASDLLKNIINDTQTGTGSLPILHPTSPGLVYTLRSESKYLLIGPGNDNIGWEGARVSVTISQYLNLNNSELFTLFGRRNSGLFFIQSQIKTEISTDGYFDDGLRRFEYNSETFNGSFIAGQPTTLEQLDNIVNSGQVSASFNGFALNQNGWATAPVAITVNYGDSTWEGSWNGGMDSTAASGATVMGFDAQGVINGNTIASTNLQALDGEVSGSVNGAFFNPDASAIGGVSDITKSTVAYKDAHDVSVFAAVKDFQPAR